MIYKKLRRTWSNGYVNITPEFIKVFPELSKMDDEDLRYRLKELNMEFYYEEKTPVNFWMRLTLPFAIVTMFLMFVLLPFAFMITGKWGYSLGDKNRIINWWRCIGL